MKILFVLSRFPYPLDKGDKLRAYYQIRDLSKTNEIHLICINDDIISQEDYNEVKKFCQSIEVVKRSKLVILFSLIGAFFNKNPFQVAYFTSSILKNKIKTFIQNEKPDIVYTQLIRLVNSIPFGLATKYYLDIMDAFSLGMKKRLLFSKWYEKFFVNWEAKKLKDFEQVATQKFDYYSIISNNDAHIFNESVLAKLEVIPNGVNEDFFLFPKAELSKKYDVIFTGNMSYHPNVQACKYLVNEILPIIKSKNVPIKICLCGITPSKEVLALASEDVEVTGYVENIKDYLDQSRVFVAPLFSGSGLQNKLLEAMAAGIPCITTSLTNKSLKARDGKEIVICNDPHKFAEQIILLKNHPDTGYQIGKLSKLFIKENFNWRACNLALEKSFQKLLSKEI